LGHKIPDLAVQFLAGKIEAALPFLGELAFVHHLRFESGVIGAGQQQRALTFQAVVAHQNVFQAIVMAVPR